MNTSVMGEDVGRVAFKSRDVSQCIGGTTDEAIINISESQGRFCLVPSPCLLFFRSSFPLRRNEVPLTSS